jgi:tetratricopeptide (TPR) repeat protein
MIVFRKTFSDDHLKIAMCFNNIGVVYYEDKKFSKALEYYQKALVIWQKHRPDNHSHSGATYNNIGEVHRYLGQYDQALKVHNLSLNILILPQRSKTLVSFTNKKATYSKHSHL